MDKVGKGALSNHSRQLAALCLSPPLSRFLSPSLSFYFVLSLVHVRCLSRSRALSLSVSVSLSVENARTKNFTDLTKGTFVSQTFAEM